MAQEKIEAEETGDSEIRTKILNLMSDGQALIASQVSEKSGFDVATVRGIMETLANEGALETIMDGPLMKFRIKTTESEEEAHLAEDSEVAQPIPMVELVEDLDNEVFEKLRKRERREPPDQIQESDIAGDFQESEPSLEDAQQAWQEIKDLESIRHHNIGTVAQLLEHIDKFESVAEAFGGDEYDAGEVAQIQSRIFMLKKFQNELDSQAAASFPKPIFSQVAKVTRKGEKRMASGSPASLEAAQAQEKIVAAQEVWDRFKRRKCGKELSTLGIDTPQKFVEEVDKYNTLAEFMTEQGLRRGHTINLLKELYDKTKEAMDSGRFKEGAKSRPDEQWTHELIHLEALDHLGTIAKFCGKVLQLLRNLRDIDSGPASIAAKLLLENKELREEVIELGQEDVLTQAQALMAALKALKQELEELR